jgi:HEAT repeat protein
VSYFSEAIQELRSISISDYEDRVEDIFYELDGEIIEEGGWPASFFPEVLNLLSDTRFLSVRTSWKLLLFIRQNWQRLSPTEVSALKNILVAAFDKFGDFTGPLLVAEILGKFYPDENTLAALKTLSTDSKPPARELVPCGFEMLAKTTCDQTLRDSAIRELRTLLKDDSEPVRIEAALSLSKIEHTN